MKTWIKVDPLLCERTRDLSDASFRAYVGALTAATWQPLPGQFRDRSILSSELNRVRRGLSHQIGELIESGRLLEVADGALEVKRWHEWQRADSGAERMARLRQMRDAAVTRHVTPGVTQADSDLVTAPVGLEGEGEREVEQSVTHQRQDVGDRYRQILGDDDAPAAPGSFMGFRPKAHPAGLNDKAERDTEHKPLPMEVCSRCSHLRIVARLTGDGKPLCNPCVVQLDSKAPEQDKSDRSGANAG